MSSSDPSQDQSLIRDHFQLQSFLHAHYCPHDAIDVGSSALAHALFTIWASKGITSYDSVLLQLSNVVLDYSALPPDGCNEDVLESKIIIAILRNELRDLPEKPPPIETLPAIIASVFIWAPICYAGNSWYELVLVPNLRCYHENLRNLGHMDFKDIFLGQEKCEQSHVEYLMTIWNAWSESDKPGMTLLMQLAYTCPWKDYSMFAVPFHGVCNFVAHTPSSCTCDLVPKMLLFHRVGHLA